MYAHFCHGADRLIASIYRQCREAYIACLSWDELDHLFTCRIFQSACLYDREVFSIHTDGDLIILITSVGTVLTADVTDFIDGLVFTQIDGHPLWQVMLDALTPCRMPVCVYISIQHIDSGTIRVFCRAVGMLRAVIMNRQTIIDFGQIIEITLFQRWDHILHVLQYAVGQIQISIAQDTGSALWKCSAEYDRITARTAHIGCRKFCIAQRQVELWLTGSQHILIKTQRYGDLITVDLCGCVRHLRCVHRLLDHSRFDIVFIEGRISDVVPFIHQRKQRIICMFPTVIDQGQTGICVISFFDQTGMRPVDRSVIVHLTQMDRSIVTSGPGRVAEEDPFTAVRLCVVQNGKLTVYIRNTGIFDAVPGQTAVRAGRYLNFSRIIVTHKQQHIAIVQLYRL